MEHTLQRARRLKGDLVVPGEVEPARLLVLLATLAVGDSQVGNVPPGVGPLVHALRRLGAEIQIDGRRVSVHGNGLQGLHQPSGAVDLTALGAFRETLLGVLAAQPFATRLTLGEVTASKERLLACLQAMGADVRRENSVGITIHAINGLAGTDHEARGLTSAARLGLLLAGLAGSGATALLEPMADRSRVERTLRQREVPVECRRQEVDELFRIVVGGGHALAPVETELAGDLLLAYPFMVAALPRRGAELCLRRVALRSHKRGLLDLLRQIGAQIDITELDNDLVDITVCYSKQLKATRVAGQRAERVSGQAALVAVLATQCDGESVLRDIRPEAAESADRVARIHALLKSLDAHVGEYPEGLVIQGGTPLGGAQLDCHGDVDMAMACAVAGVLAHGETTISGTECLEAVYPDFFAALDSVKE
jgi:3-phosphoshikimate 1-carboxyvinyltransferase